MRKHKKLIAPLLVLALLALTLTGCGGANTGSKTDAAKSSDSSSITLKVGHVLAPDHPYNLGLEKFAELVDQKTQGKVKVEVFHSSQLGNEREMIEGLQMGTVDMALVSTAPLMGFTKKFMVFDLPYIFETREHAYKTLDSEFGQELLKSLEEKGIVGLAYWENGFRHLTNSVRPVVHPSDVKGLKIRTMENKVHMESFRVLGADPTPMAFGELFTALQQKTVDGQENPLAQIETSKFYEVQKYLSMTGHFYAPAPLLISKQKWDTIPADLQDKIKSAAIEARDYERGLVQKADTELKEKLKSRGMQVIDVDINEWREAMSPVYQMFEAEIGKDVIEKVKSFK
ncbi:MAG: TRAP transporter substrate-binding protein [Firmicutes bacterium]|nr:TRAP transporter substrate-binding protein [Bacillota bacterium]